MVSNNRRQAITGALAVSVAAILWGLDGIVLTPRLYNLNIIWVVFVVHCIPFILMNFFLFREYKHLKEFTRGDYLFMGLISLFGGAIGTLAIVKALFLLNFQSLTVVVLLQKLQPVFAITLAALLLKEKLKKHFLFWTGLAIVAGYLLTFGLSLPNFHTGFKTLYAALFALLAAFSFGSSTVFSKKILIKYNFITATFFRYGFTTLFMLVFVLATGKLSQVYSTTSFNWFIFLIIGFTTGSGAIFLFYYGLKRIKAILATICELFFPMSAILFDYLFNHNRLSLVQWIGAAVMIFAIIRLNTEE